jgi:hypothetical protein
MNEPARFPRIQNEAAVRLLAADLVGEEAVLQSLRALREEIDRISAQLDAAEVAAEAIPSRTEYLLLNHRLGPAGPGSTRGVARRGRAVAARRARVNTRVPPARLARYETLWVIFLRATFSKSATRQVSTPSPSTA